MRIDIWEQEQETAKMIAYELKVELEEVRTFCSFEDLEKNGKKRKPDLILLYEGESDTWAVQSLDRLKGDSVLEKIPVMVIASSAEENEKIKCLDGGAEGFLTEPLGMMELHSYIYAVMRSYKGTKPEEHTVCSGDLRIFQSECRCFAGDRELALCPSEIGILTVLVEHAGAVLSSYQIANEMKKRGVRISHETVKARIHTLKSKLPDGKNQLRTVRGIGYQFEKKDRNARKS